MVGRVHSHLRHRIKAALIKKSMPPCLPGEERQHVGGLSTLVIRTVVFPLDSLDTDEQDEKTKM